MAPVSLYDELEIKRLKSGRNGEVKVLCNHPEVPSGKRNLVYRAASLLMAQKGVRGAVQIRLRKRIPVGAGLGGGSSDAAATLKGLNRLFRLGLSRKEMLSLAASLGADVPFFIYSRPARASGIGERIEPLPAFPRFWMVLLYPGFPVSTAWAYRKHQLTLTKSVVNTSINFSPRDLEELSRSLINDLERVTIRSHRRIASLKQKLIREGALAALMSGSGSSVFGIFSAGQKARKAFLRLRSEKGVQSFLVRSLS
jgi:4-diphosphocytidyl-2-C-methyl-D-erythritol kinase